LGLNIETIPDPRRYPIQKHPLVNHAVNEIRPRTNTMRRNSRIVRKSYAELFLAPAPAPTGVWKRGAKVGGENSQHQ